MTFKAAQCPSCGGSLQVPDDYATVHCLYCGGTVVVSEAIQAAKVASVPNLLKLARTAAESSNHKAAYDYFSRVLELDRDNAEAWGGKAEAAGQLSRVSEMVKCFRNEIDLAQPESMQEVRKVSATSICRLTMQSFKALKARKAPAFNEDEAWNLYLSRVDHMVKALEDAHLLSPDSTEIIQAILYVCDSNPQTVIFLPKGSTSLYDRSARGIPAELNNALREKRQIYVEKLYARDPAASPLEPDLGPPQPPCFIATATMGNHDHPVVILLREFRDNWLLKHTSGRSFIRYYYRYGPYPAEVINRSKSCRRLSYILIVWPLARIAKALLEHRVINRTSTSVKTNQ